MSHEIRTPMNGVIGMTGLLLQTELTDEQLDMVETIRCSGDALLSVINDILDFSKIEAGKMELEKHPFELERCIEDIIDLFSVKVTDKQIGLYYEISPEIPDILIGDNSRLRQILVNLVGNAVKFTEKGHVILSVIKVSEKNNKLMLKFSIKDTGIGIPEDKLNLLFQPFSQAETAKNRKFGGTGLGLAISRKLIRLMGGETEVISKPNLGSEFSFTIQADTLDAFDKVKLKNNIIKGKKVLLIESNPAAREISRRKLEGWEMKTYPADSVDEALKLIAGGIKPDLIITEYPLQGTFESKLSAIIRKGVTEEKLPVILLSSLGKAKSREIQKDAFTGIIAKPIKYSQLLKTINSLFTENRPKVNEYRAAFKIDNKLSNLYPLRILLAEDNAINQKLALKVLNKMGYLADVAGNGLEVLESLKRQNYDLILMDVQMPEMDGLEAAQQINDVFEPQTRPVIIAMTASAMTGDRETCLQAGMDDYISKPFVLENLQDLLIKWGNFIKTKNLRVRDTREEDKDKKWISNRETAIN